MKFYYAGRDPDSRGAVLIHADDCSVLPGVLKRNYLGIFPNSELAKNTAIDKLQLSRVKICQCCE